MLGDIIHDQSIVFSELRLDARYGITETLGVQVVVPLRLIDTSIVYRDRQTGVPVELENPDVHHRNETLVGIFDPWLLGSYQWTRGPLRLLGKLGSTIPAGRTEEDPFAAGDMGIEHQHLQFGTGTLAPIAGIDGLYSFERWAITASLLSVQNLYENSKGYKAGDRYIAGVNAISRLGTESWLFQLGVIAQAETAERWNGTVADEGNQGRFDALATAGVSRKLGEHFEANLGVTVPILTEVKGGQLDYPAVAQLGLSGTFELLGGEDEHDHGDDDHDHDHGDEHGDDDGHDEHGATDAAGLDIVEIASAGEAVALVPVAGVVTVFDFWATWCKPCKRLNADLIELMKKHPGKIALRKINVVDWDSEASATYLMPGKFNLPHVKVYTPDGNLSFERSAPPDELVRAVEKLIGQ